MQTITPFLWFDGNAEEAMKFYVSIFKKKSKIVSIQRQGKNGPVFGGTFQLLGQNFHVLNGGPQFKFNESISFFVNCETQKDVDMQNITVPPPIIVEDDWQFPLPLDVLLLLAAVLGFGWWWRRRKASRLTTMN